jgi:hypothetical protein
VAFVLDARTIAMQQDDNPKLISFLVVENVNLSLSSRCNMSIYCRYATNETSLHLCLDNQRKIEYGPSVHVLCAVCATDCGP